MKFFHQPKVPEKAQMTRTKALRVRTTTDKEIFEFIETGFEYVCDLDEATFFRSSSSIKKWLESAKNC